MAYAIDFTPAARRAFAKLTPAVRERLAPAIDALAREPRPAGAVKLRGVPNGYRIRVGDHRVLYQIEDDRLLVLVVGVGHRREVYRSRP